MVKSDYKLIYLIVLLINLILFIFAMIGIIDRFDETVLIPFAFALMIFSLLGWIVDSRIDITEAIKIRDTPKMKKSEFKKFAQYKLIAFIVFVVLVILTMLLSIFNL